MATRISGHPILTHALSKGCDWILANDVSPDTGTFGGDDNKVHGFSRFCEMGYPRRDFFTPLQTRFSDLFTRLVFRWAVGKGAL